MFGALVDHLEITETDIARGRAEPRFKQILLAKVLEQLLGTLYRLQHEAKQGEADAPGLREGALMAVQLADMIRAIDDRLRVTPRA